MKNCICWCLSIIILLSYIVLYLRESLFYLTTYIRLSVLQTKILYIFFLSPCLLRPYVLIDINMW